MIRGADIEAKDINLRTPLLVAATYGQMDAIRVLIHRKTDMATLDKNKRSIFITCQLKHTAVLKVITICVKTNGLGYAVESCIDQSTLFRVAM